MTQQFEQLIETLGYLGILIGLYIEHVFPPAPAQVVIPIAGFLVGRGELTFLGVWISGTIGGVLGSCTLYWLGRWLDERFVRTFVRKHGKWLTVSEADLDRTLRLFDRWGNWLVLISHMIPLSPVRVFMSLTAGANRMGWLRFALYSTLGTILWIGGQLYLAVLVGENWEELAAQANRYSLYLWIGGGICTVLVVFWYLRRWRRQHFKLVENQGSLSD